MSGSGWVLDLGLEDLISEVMSIADPRYGRSRIGTIAGPLHRQSGPHMPEDSADADAPGNPDNQVDAVDIDHAPELGVDCAEITETVRRRKEPRVKLVIWDGRQFSNYTHDGIAPYTWRPYSGEDMHRTHCHVEANDVHHDQRGPWGVAEMTTDDILTRTWREFRDVNANGTLDAKTIPQFLAEVDAIVDEMRDKMNAQVAQAQTVALTDAQVVLFAKTVAAELAAKLTVTFTPNASAPATAE